VTQPSESYEDFYIWSDKFVTIFLDDDDTWKEVEIDILDYFIGFIEKDEKDMVNEFMDSVKVTFVNKIFDLLTDENPQVQFRATQIFANIISVLHELEMEMIADRGLVDILYDLLEKNYKEYEEIVLNILRNIFISDCSLVDEFVSDIKVITRLLDKVTSFPDSSENVLKCLENFFNNLESRAVEEFVRDNPAIVEFFLNKVSVDRKETTMLSISRIVKILINIGNNLIEHNIMEENPVKGFILNSNDMLDKITEGQRHKSQVVNEEFLKIVVEYFERPEEYLD
jgi:hypothetical protein